jgi:hypothetical protein
MIKHCTWSQDKQSQYYPFGVSGKNPLSLFRNNIYCRKAAIKKSVKTNIQAQLNCLLITMKSSLFLSSKECVLFGVHVCTYINKFVSFITYIYNDGDRGNLQNLRVLFCTKVSDHSIRLHCTQSQGGLITLYF